MVHKIAGKTPASASIRTAAIILCGLATGGFSANGLATRQSSAEQDAAARSRAQAIAAIREQIAGRENQPAEIVFKNIVFLKGRPASLLPSMMAALPGLLGVDCSYCHEPGAWEKETKPAKQRAREMFQMIKDINQDYFGGKNAVSCWTCHRGSPHPPISGG